MDGLYNMDDRLIMLFGWSMGYVPNCKLSNLPIWRIFLIGFSIWLSLHDFRGEEVPLDF